MTVRGGSRRQRGFTLVELLIVVVLIGLIVGIGIPNLRRSMIRADMMSQMTMIKQAIAVSRIYAIKNSSQVALQLLPNDDAPVSHYQIHAWVDADADGDFDATEEEVGRWPMTGDITIGVENDPPTGGSENSSHTLHGLDGDALGVVFLANGTAMTHDNQVGTGQGAVVLEDEYGNLIRIVIQGGSGSVLVDMWDRSINDYSERLNLWRY